MKRLLFTVIAAVLVLVTAFSQDQNVILVNNETDFRKIADATLYEGKSFYKVKIKLTQDIILQGDSILPIGMYPLENETSFPFQGEFDGDGHTITIKAPFSIYRYSYPDEEYGYMHTKYYSGLFGIVGTAGAVMNLNIVLEDISSFVDHGQIGSFGIVAGMNAGLIYNCNVAGSYSITTVTHNFFDYGSIAGTLNRQGTISNCYNQANLIVNKISKVGGIVGMSYSGTIFKCYNSGNLVIEECTSMGGDGRSVGGIVGECNGNGSDFSPYIVNCINYGRIVTNSNAISVGGITGKCAGNGVIFYCGNCGDILSDAEYIGGIIGRLISSAVVGSYHAGCMFHSNGEKDKNKIIGIRWWGDEENAECYTIGNCNRKVSPEVFARKANSFYSKAKSVLSSYLRADDKTYSDYFQPEPWSFSTEEPYPYFLH